MRTNNDKLELFADVLEPAGRIIADKAWALKWQDGDRLGAIREAIKGHKADIVDILARIDGVDPAEYQIDGLSLFMRLAAMFNRPDLEFANGLFTSQAQSADAASSGPATANIKESAN